MITETEIGYVVSIETHRSFSGAARAIGISQSAVTQAIGKLESKLGTRLFHRVAGGVQLTPDGRTLLPIFRRAHSSIRSIEHAAAMIADVRIGTLSVACPPSIARDPVASILGAFARRHPGIDFALSNLGIEIKAFDLVQAGTAEVILTASDTDLDGLHIEPVGTVPLLAIIPPGLRLSVHPTLDEIVALGVLMTTGFGVVRREISRHVGADRLSEATVLESDFQGFLNRMALEGMGVLFVPEGSARKYELLGARVVQPAERPSLELVAARLADHSSVAVDGFVDLARETISAASDG